MNSREKAISVGGLTVALVFLLLVGLGCGKKSGASSEGSSKQSAGKKQPQTQPSNGSGPASNASSGSQSPTGTPEVSTGFDQVLDKVGVSTNSGTQGWTNTGDDQAKSFADAALVSQALFRNRDKPVSAIPASELPPGTGAITMPTADSYKWTSDGGSFTWDNDGVRFSFARGGGVQGQCPVIKPAPPASIPSTVAEATGDQEHDRGLQYERTKGGAEADLVVRTGDINNLGFGWPQGFDPFSGQSTPQHAYPWKARPGSAAGTDRIMLGSSFGAGDSGYDGYSHSASCSCPAHWAPCQNRLETMPQPVTLLVGTVLGMGEVHDIVFQIFVDDFQPKAFGSHFQVSLNGTRIPTFEYAINSLDQTGPIGKLLTLRLLPEYWPLLKSDTVKLLIDDPTTHIGDGYALDFVRILINPYKFKYQVSLTASVMDADTHAPISGASVAAAPVSATSDKLGKCQLKGLPAGLVIATATAPGYDQNSVPVDLPAGQTGQAEIPLHRHEETTAALESSIRQTGSVAIYGIHFDSDSAKLRADSMPALNAVLGLINNHPTSRWVISGHTDNQGTDARNQPLSQQRAGAVVAWLRAHGVDEGRLDAQGLGASRPVADNSTANGRALNRRVEIAAAQ